MKLYELPAKTLVKQAHAGTKLVSGQYPEAAAILREIVTRYDLLREAHQQAAKADWVKCEELMPNEYEVVIVSSANRSQAQLYYWMPVSRRVKRWFRSGTKSHGEDIEIFTHWMPLPAAPAQETNND
uniref:DUF551 domain-containing protein n=1 Tax=Hafnia alvei TaxID=569 RepID=UPI0026F0479F|nr:DUF551 domain-containing protein [Hafnia alvei]